MKKEISKQAMQAAREYIGERIALAFGYRPRKRKDLEPWVRPGQADLV